MHISSRFRARALCAAASTLAFGAGAYVIPTSALAQATPAESGKATALGEVIVTAQKRSENLQKVPVAITAFTAQMRDKSGIVSAQQQMNFTPGVTYDPSTDHLDIRGVGRVTTYIGTDPGVAVYQDGYYVGSADNLGQSTLEEDRVEVLRGPQGTLYGRNSIGGAVNSISRRPDSEYNGEVRINWNDYMGETVEARISGPVTDWLKLSAYAQENSQSHGYFTDVPPHTAAADPNATGAGVPVGGYPAATCSSLNFASVQPLTCNSFKGYPGWDGIGHGWVGDFQASYDLGPNFDGWVRAYFNNEFSRPEGAPGITPWNPISLTVPSVFYGFQGIQEPGLYNNRDITSNLPNSDTIENKQFITQDTWHGDGFNVKFTGGYWDTSSDFSEDGDAVPIAPSGIYSPTFFGSGLTELTNASGIHITPAYIGPIPDPAHPGSFISNDVATALNPTDNTVVNPNQLQVIEPYHLYNWSTELNIASTNKGPLQWLAGLYYYNERTDSDFSYQELDTPQYDHVTDYLFNTQKGCYPVLGPAAVPGGEANYNTTAGGCPYGTVAQIFGYNGTTPSTIDNSPGGALEQAFGFHNPNSGVLYAFNARLRTQSEAVFGQLDWRPNDQWHFTLGARYSGDQKQGYEQEIDVFWIPLVANQAQAQALGFPIDPATGKYVQDYVGTSCSTPGENGILPYNATTPCPAHRSVKDSWGAPTGTAGVEWTPNNDTNVYVRYNRGYKSGGFNLGPLATPGVFQIGNALEVNPEFIDDFEGGWKQSFGHTFQFDIAGFYYLYHGLQALNATIQNSQPPIQINELINIQQASSYGVELETKWSPIENLLILLNYSYLHTSNDTACTWQGSAGTGQPAVLSGAGKSTEQNCFVDSADPAAGTTVNGQTLSGVNPAGPYLTDSSGNTLQAQSLKGDPLPYSPQHKVSASVSYTFNFEPGDLTLAGVWNWHASFYDNLFATQEWLVPGGQTTDFRVTWGSHSGRYQVIASVSNAFNSNVLTAYTTLPPGNAYYAYDALQPPRVFSVELRYKF